MVISIEHAEYVGDYKIALQFSDGVKNIVDFADFLSASLNPMTRRYLDVEKFKNFQVIHGDLIWNDYEMCFPIWDLHQGNL